MKRKKKRKGKKRNKKNTLACQTMFKYDHVVITTYQYSMYAALI
jgi:hypothetical protein